MFDSFTEEQCAGMPDDIDPCSGSIKFYKESTGVISSPNHPNRYPNQRTCRYAIDVKGNITSQDVYIYTLLVLITYRELLSSQHIKLFYGNCLATQFRSKVAILHHQFFFFNIKPMIKIQKRSEVVKT